MPETDREFIRAQHATRIHGEAERDAERLRGNLDDLAEIKAVNEDLDEIGAW